MGDQDEYRSRQTELRLFISSTFRDLQEEREHLVRKVFPEIRALCRQRGVTFTDVDLRWGLTEEQATLGTVIRTCLEEVDRCRPFFIGMLGSRYGWVPELHEILIDPHLLASFPFIEELAVQGASVTEMEFVHGVFNAADMNRGDACFYHRPVSLEETDAPEQLASLIERSRATGHPFRTFGDVEELGRMVREDLLAMIDREWPGDDSPDELEIEVRAHRAFAASRTRAYIPNPIHLKEFSRWADEGETPLVVRGESGLGKSSLVAFLSDTYRKKNPDALVIEHYVGSSERGGTPRSVMRHLIGAIRKRFDIADEIPVDRAHLEQSFPGWLLRAQHRAAEAGVKVLLVIDALNQLEFDGGSIGWIPREIPSGVKLLLSTTPGEIDDRLAGRGWEEIVVAPIDEPRIRQSIVIRYLSEFHKGVAPESLRRITEDGNSPSPLFLRVVAEELRLHGDHDTLEETVGRYLDLPTLHDLFQEVLIRLEEDYGTGVVRPFLSTIALSRAGLSEEHLREICDIGRLDLSRLLFSLDYHLLRRDGRLGFFHDYLRRGVEERYLGSTAEKVEGHRRLAEHFQRIIDGEIERGGNVSRQDALELCHQLEGAGMIEGLLAAVTRIPICMALWSQREAFELLEYWSTLGRDYDIEAAYSEALDAWRQTNADPAKTLSVLVTIGRLMSRTGHRSRSIDFYREAVRIAQEIGNRRIEAGARAQIGNRLRESGETDLAFEELSRARVIFEELGDEAEIASTTGQIGLVYRDRGEYDRALECYRVQEDTFRRLGESRRLLVAVGNAGNVYSRKGEIDRALACFREVEEICRDSGDYHGLSISLGNTGHLYVRLGEPAKAEALFTEQEELCRRLGDFPGVARALNGLGTVVADQGDVDRALEIFEEMMTIMRAYDDQRGLFFALENLGQLHVETGADERAREAFSEALEISDRLEFRSGRAAILSCIAAIHIGHGEVDQAEGLLREALVIRRDLGERFDELEAICQLAEVHLQRGDTAAGFQCLAEGITGLRKLNASHSLRKFLVVTVEQLVDLGAKVAEGEREDSILDEVIPLFHQPEPQNGKSPDSLHGLIDDIIDEIITLDGERPAPDISRLQGLRGRIDSVR